MRERAINATYDTSRVIGGVHCDLCVLVARAHARVCVFGVRETKNGCCQMKTHKTVVVSLAAPTVLLSPPRCEHIYMDLRT